MKKGVNMKKIGENKGRKEIWKKGGDNLLNVCKKRKYNLLKFFDIWRQKMYNYMSAIPDLPLKL